MKSTAAVWKRSWRKIKGEEIELAVLKARSPTCGVREIYDGTFTGTKIKGAGIFAEALYGKRNFRDG